MHPRPHTLVWQIVPGVTDDLVDIATNLIHARERLCGRASSDGVTEHNLLWLSKVANGVLALFSGFWHHLIFWSVLLSALRLLSFTAHLSTMPFSQDVTYIGKPGLDEREDLGLHVICLGSRLPLDNYQIKVVATQSIEQP